MHTRCCILTMGCGAQQGHVLSRVTRGEGGAEGTWRLIGRRAQGQASAPCLRSLYSSSTLRYVAVCRKLSSARLRVFRTAKV